MNITDSLNKDLRKFNTAPFLFIGSGLSRRYLNLEDWKGLLKRFCVDSGMKPFEFYFGKAGSKYPKAASLMAVDFFNIWWNDVKYTESRNQSKEYGEIINESSPLKFEISKYLMEKMTRGIDESMSKEIERLKEIEVDGIITTNWDSLLEQVFREFDVFIGQKDLLNSQLQEVAEIYKIQRV